jgi:hypothetical protein
MAIGTKSRRDKPKDWNTVTIVNQFIERVKLYKLLLRNRKIEAANSQINSNDTRAFPLPRYIFLDPPISEIECDEFAKLNPIIIWNSSASLFEEWSGSSSIIQEKAWRELIRLPVQIVDGEAIFKIRLNGSFPDPNLRLVDPYIEKDRMFISIDVNTDEKILKEAFLRLLKEQNIPRKSNRETDVTATSEKVIKHAFIQTLGFRILKMHQNKVWSQDEEVKFVTKKLAFRFSDPAHQDYGARKAATRSVKLLNDWLSDSSHITKLIESLGQ